MCCKKLRSLGIKTINGKMKSPNLTVLFGEKLIVDDFEFARCSEAEKRRHLYEDGIIRFLYLENQSYEGCIVIE